MAKILAQRPQAPHAAQVAENSEYLYLVSNNTIFGTQFRTFPDTDKMLVCDMSSDILSRPVDVSRFGLIFAGAQKNLGPAGVTVVVIREDLLSRSADNIPTMLKYRTHAEKGSMFNTPPCIAIYVVYRVLQWLKGLGGVEEIQKINLKKADTLYQIIDQHYPDFLSAMAAQGRPPPGPAQAAESHSV